VHAPNSTLFIQLSSHFILMVSNVLNTGFESLVFILPVFKEVLLQLTHLLDLLDFEINLQGVSLALNHAFAEYLVLARESV